MKHRMTGGNEPLSTAGLVAFTPCSHRWTYPTRVDHEQMHELAGRNLGVACSCCLAAWLDATYARAGGTTWRVN